MLPPHEGIALNEPNQLVFNSAFAVRNRGTRLLRCVASVIVCVKKLPRTRSLSTACKMLEKRADRELFGCRQFSTVAPRVAPSGAESEVAT